jgi:hypothetical protein
VVEAWSKPAPPAAIGNVAWKHREAKAPLRFAAFSTERGDVIVRLPLELSADHVDGFAQGLAGRDDHGRGRTASLSG